jgi:integrase
LKSFILDEAKRLFKCITDKRDMAIFLIAHQHGLRAGEVGLLRLPDLDLTRWRIMRQRLMGS